MGGLLPTASFDSKGFVGRGVFSEEIVLGTDTNQQIKVLENLGGNLYLTAILTVYYGGHIGIFAIDSGSPSITITKISGNTQIKNKIEFKSISGKDLYLTSIDKTGSIRVKLFILFSDGLNVNESMVQSYNDLSNATDISIL